MRLGFNFKSEPLHADIEIFEHMKVAESIYEGARAPSQSKHPRAESNQARGRKTQVVKSDLSTGSAKNHSSKHKSKYYDRSKNDNPDTPSCMIHGDGHSS